MSKTITNRWKTFYLCDCPEQPESNGDTDVIQWYMRHINNCPPRPVVDLHLPEIEGIE